ncbi:unnamed protein product [Aphis gossypii]|uniref:Uncharacterized protein n=1 Tax=Aphis gossypii TaxID=80765 RepID=A0A9P0IPP2_APHGO|nr:unnamed protein product [Aphis gossypii]
MIGICSDNLDFLFGLLGQKNSLDVWQHTALGDGNTGQQFVQFFVISDGQLQMSGNDTRLLVVTGCVTGQLQNFSCQVFHDGGQVHWCSGSDTFGVVSFSQQTVDTTDRELESGTGRPGLGFTSFGFACFASSAHDCSFDKRLFGTVYVDGVCAHTDMAAVI